MAHHTLTYHLGGTIAVEAEFLVTPDGGLELTEAALGGQVVDDPTAIGERRGGIWHSLDELLTDAARQRLERWIDEEKTHDRELGEPG